MSPSWKRLFTELRNSGWYSLARRLAVKELQARDCEEIGSSDINHVIYSQLEGAEGNRGQLAEKLLEWTGELV